MTVEQENCKHVVFSNRAYLGIAIETMERWSTETGGVLLGNIHEGIWYVVDCIDPGPGSTFTPTYVEYDHQYVNHLANKLARLWSQKLEVLGLWHRHPGSLDTFSTTDNGTNQNYASLYPRGAISGLVNIDPDFRFTLYHVTAPHIYNRVSFEISDDIPNHITKLKSIDDVLPKKRLLSNLSSLLSSNSYLYQEKHPPGLGHSTSRQSTELDEQDDQAVLLDMLEIEMAYLSTLESCEYSVRYDTDSLNVVLRPIGVKQNNFKVLTCNLKLQAGRRICKMEWNIGDANGGKETDWQPGIVCSVATELLADLKFSYPKKNLKDFFTKRGSNE